MASSIMINEFWTLRRYAFFVSDEQHTERGYWKHYAAENKDLLLTYSEMGQIMVAKRTDILESFTVCNGEPCTRGVAKGDSMMIVIKFQNNMRRFRIQFEGVLNKTGAEQCQDCLKKFSKFFPISQPNRQIVPNSAPQELHGNVQISDIVKAVSGDAQLPTAYEDHAPSSEEIGNLLHIFLTDPHFPAFVGQVEKVLKDIVKE